MRTKNRTTSTPTKKGATRATRALTLERLPAEQLRHLVRPHNGFEAFVDLFTKLVAEHGDELGSGIDVGAMRTAIENAQSLQAAHDQAAAQLAAAQEQVALVSDTELVQLCNGWTEMLLIYGHARQAARTNAQIEVALEPFVRFMKHARAKKPVVSPTAA